MAHLRRISKWEWEQAFWQQDKQMVICNARVAFATETEERRVPCNFINCVIDVMLANVYLCR